MKTIGEVQLKTNDNGLNVENSNTHIYLYAKYHYKITDPVEDLKQIISRRNNIEPQYISERDIVMILSGIAYKHIEYEQHFIDFVMGLLDSKEDLYHSIIKSLLFVLRFTKVEGLNLGVPDFTILPKKGQKQCTHTD